MKNTIFKQLTIASLSLALGLASCSGGGGNKAAQNANNPADRQLLGGGSTFGYPIYSKMFAQYGQMDSIQTNYQSIGSGGGINGLMNRQFDFGASDAFLNDEQMAKFPAPILHMPTVLGSVVLMYNLPGNPVLKFSPDVIAGIFMKTITKWNDPKIMADNPGVQLPDEDITPVHRSDGSGTTFIFTDYLFVFLIPIKCQSTIHFIFMDIIANREIGRHAFFV